MSKPFERLFLEHPRAVHETYVQHFGVAFGFAWRLIGAGLAALVHAFVPCLFEKTASAEIRRLNAKLEARGKPDVSAPGQPHVHVGMGTLLH